MKSKVVTQEVYDKYIELTEKHGLSQRNACKALNLSRGAIQRVLYKMKVEDVILGVQLENDYSDWKSKPKPSVQESMESVLKVSDDSNLGRQPLYQFDLDVKKNILVIADTQCKSEEDLEYMLWIGHYIAEKRPDVIIHIGDHYDFPSLSSYDKGKSSAEGKRLVKDIEAGNIGFEYLNMAMQKHKDYNPRKIFCLGNHENRLDRYIDDNPELIGTLGTDFLPFNKYGWEVHPFLKPVEVNGIFFVHYLANPFSGKPYGGNAMNILKTVGRSFVVGHKQCLDIAIRPTIDGKQQIGIVNGACLTPDHKVLHADLTYRPLGELKVGDKLVSFEEDVKGRKSRRYRTGTVEKVKRSVKPCFKVSLKSGKSFKVTGDHLWVVKKGSMYEWRETSKMRIGTRVPRFLEEWEQDLTYEAGWLSGLYDGEGCYSVRQTNAGFVGQLQMSQKEGLVQDRFEKSLVSIFDRIATTCTAVKRDVVQSRVQGGMRQIARVLGTLRPTRLLPKFKPEHLGRLWCNESDLDTVTSIEPIGEQEIVMVSVDEKTMIVEGYAHHNCYDHNESYKGYQGNNHFRGLTVLHEVQDGFAVPMFVSLDYMKEKYYS